MDVSVNPWALTALASPSAFYLLRRYGTASPPRAKGFEFPQSHKDELDRRLAARDANPDSGTRWEDVKTRLQK